MDTIEAKIEERGNGLPTKGDYVPGDDGEIYRVEETWGPIQTTGGRGNWVHARVVLADWTDCAEGDEFKAQVVGAE